MKIKQNTTIPFLSNQGQGLSEYVMVALLVMAAIIIMGPYIVRSWNAQQKGWDDSVKDSFNDPFAKGNGIDDNDPCAKCVTAYPCPNPPCCGFNSSCAATEQTQQLYCPPVAEGEDACTRKDEITCTANLNCCTDPIPVDPTKCGPPECPEGGTMSSYKCGNDDTTRYKCAYNEKCVALCPTGIWGDWQSNPAWPTCNSTNYRFRIRECNDNFGALCLDCICPTDDQTSTPFGELHIGIEKQDAMICQ
ncbi:MAG: hypothetical protein HQL25_08010 [Candidatus Omnitrophica bacterium]|nr:hypothetical protein [Candidatus Omnitrophota bacterium]